MTNEKPAKLRVLHIIKSLGRGGAEMLLPETLVFHDKERFEFHYIYFLPWKDQMVEAIQHEGGKVTCFNASNNIKIILQILRVIKYIHVNNIDIIHAHLPWAGFLARFVHKFHGIPVIYTEHNKQERYHKLTFMLNKLTFRWQDLAISVSNDVEQSILANIGKKTKVKTILNGVNLHKFERQKTAVDALKTQLGVPQNTIVIGTVAVFRFQKRLKEWMQVFKAASKNNPTLFGVIVGDGPLKGDLLAERKRLGLEEKILMPGLQTNTVEWFSVFDIFMMTSVFEGLPIALLEAMSMRCAIVTTSAGGIKEAIEHEKSGLMVEVDKWPDLSQHLNNLKTNHLESYGIAARKRVIEKFSMDIMVNELEKVYLSISGKI
ncbi:MAG: glycosyltransferase [Bacteroidota bacterium]